MKLSRNALVGLVVLVGVLFLLVLEIGNAGPLGAELREAGDGTRRDGSSGSGGGGAGGERNRAAELDVLKDTLMNLRNELKSLSASQSQIHSAHREISSKSESMVEKISMGSDSPQHVVGSGSTGRLEGEKSSSSSLARSRDSRESTLRGASISSAVKAPPRVEVTRDPIIQSPGDGEKKNKKAVLFTMDSITSYEENSRNGGAAGEILIRKSLEGAFQHFGVDLRVIRSDKEFESVKGADYDIIIVDPWTWAARGWVPKPPLRGQDSKVYILDFFGSPKLRGKGLKIPPKRFLTAFGSAWNTFLGYYVEEPPAAPGAGGAGGASTGAMKLQQGVIWGKDPKHFEGRVPMLEAALNAVPGVTLVSTSTRQIFQHPRMLWKGHQTPQSWRKLLRESKFLIGLGDPLLGPSAIDAISAGCVYINPQYGKPKKDRSNQHPYAAEHIGSPYVCNYRLGDSTALQQCITQALQANLKPHSIPEFEKAAHFKRVAEIFDL